MSIKNFRINKAQAWTLSTLGYYTEDTEVVINAESYDADDGTFEFALEIKDGVPDSVWAAVEADIRDNGWAFYLMLANGKTEPILPEDD